MNISVSGIYLQRKMLVYGFYNDNMKLIDEVREGNAECQVICGIHDQLIFALKLRH